mgnify:CR=1 FL=1
MVAKLTANINQYQRQSLIDFVLFQIRELSPYMWRADNSV